MNWVNLIICGTVQGVGFRAWANNQALTLGLTGWVKNRGDGSVELVAQGDRNSLEKLVDVCWDGPEGSWVEDVKVSWGTAHGELSGFKVIE